MASQNKLVFVTWNTNGIKKTHRSPQKFSELLDSLTNLKASVVFIQETHVGKDCYKILEDIQDWKAYFTVHSSRSKGVAILIRDNVPFKYICHDEDCSGGYIVLFCCLYGEPYTLVNVYKHNADKIVLGRLKEYLRVTTEGVLVVGGDFNTDLDSRSGRRSSPILQNFTDSLKLKDTWSHKNGLAEGFTWHQSDKHSRIDMFFLPEDLMERVESIEVEENEGKDISDHYPLVLKLQRQTERKLLYFPKKFGLEYKKLKNNRRPGMISGAEILSAIKSLQDETDLQDSEEHRPDTGYIFYIPVHTWRSLTENLKTKYNDIIMRQQVPEYLDSSIFSEVLAKRLNVFISLGANCVRETNRVIVRSPLTIKWSFLKTTFGKLDQHYKRPRSKYAPFAPEPDFGIVESLLAKHSSGDLRDLQPGCPLTSAILNLALNQLNVIIRCKTKCKTVLYDKQILHINAQQDKQEQVVGLVKKFEDDSGVSLRYE